MTFRPVVSVGEQIREQILRAIHAGVIAPGERIDAAPTATALGVAVDEVQRALRALARDSRRVVACTPGADVYAVAHPQPDDIAGLLADTAVLIAEAVRNGRAHHNHAALMVCAYAIQTSHPSMHPAHVEAFLGALIGAGLGPLGDALARELAVLRLVVPDSKGEWLAPVVEPLCVLVTALAPGGPADPTDALKAFVTAIARAYSVPS